MVNVPPDASIRLAILQALPKFEEGGLYPGPTSAEDKIIGEAAINSLCERMSRVVSEKPTEAALLKEIELTLPMLEALDTEDREMALTHIEQVMDAVGLESSGGMLNEWLYGFDPDGLRP